MNSTHINDVVFTRDSLNKFIKLIKTEGIKNLDYYIMSPDISITNALGKPEFSIGEKTIFNGNLAIVNKSYYNVDPYVKLDPSKNQYKNILKYNFKNIFNLPFDELTDTISFGLDDIAQEYYININKKINSSNFNFIVDHQNKTFNYTLDSNLISAANNILRYALLKKTSDNTYEYYNNNDNNTINFNLQQYSHDFKIPYEFSAVKNEDGVWEIKTFDGTSDINANLLEAAEEIKNGFTLNDSNLKLYYQGLKTVKYDNFKNQDTNVDEENIDIVTYQLNNNDNKWNIAWNTTGDHIRFEDKDPLLLAFQNESIGPVEENTFTGSKASNYYQIFWDSTDDHKLDNLAISFGYNESGQAQTSSNNKVYLLYNQIIPVRSIKIKSWEQLTLGDSIKTFPNIEDKNYSAPYDKNKQIYGKWQPSDLINLFSNYQIMKEKQQNIDDSTDLRVYAISKTKTNAHQIVFTPDDVEVPMIDINAYEECSGKSTTNTNYNQFQYIVLDQVDRTYKFKATAVAGDLSFNTDLTSLAAESLTTTKTIASADIVNNTDGTVQKISYYSANVKTRGPWNNGNCWAPPVDSIVTKNINNNSMTTNHIFTWPVANTSKTNVYWTDMGWEVKYNPTINSVCANITVEESESEVTDSIETVFELEFDPFYLSNAQTAILTADVKINIIYNITTTKTTENFIPIYVLPLDITNIAAADSIYNGKISNNNYYGLFMQNQKLKSEEPLKYYLISYIPQNYFWESDLLTHGINNNNNDDKKAWRILLQDRFNNAINNTLTYDDINTKYVELHKDLNIFDIALSSSTKTDGAQIPTSPQGFYNCDLGLYQKDNMNPSRAAVYRIQYNPNVIDGNDVYYFSNYNDVELDLAQRKKYQDNIIKYDTSSTTYNIITTAKYTQVNDASSLIETWEKEKLYGTISTTATPNTTTNINSIRSTDYFLYNKISEPEVYKDTNRFFNIDLYTFTYELVPNNSLKYQPGQYYIKNESNGQYILSTTREQLPDTNYYMVTEKRQIIESLQSLDLYYKRLQINNNIISHSYSVHPSFFDVTFDEKNDNNSIIQYKEIDLTPYEPNKYNYYTQVNIFNEEGYNNFRQFSSSLTLYYKNNEYQSCNQNHTYYIANIYYLKNELNEYQEITILDQEDYNQIYSLYTNNLYFQDGAYIKDISHTYNSNYTYYIQELDNADKMTLDRDYYCNVSGDNTNDLVLIKNLYQPNVFYYYNGTNYVLATDTEINFNYQYYERIELNNIKQVNILNRFNNRFYENKAIVLTLTYLNEKWYKELENNTFEEFPQQSNRIYIYLYNGSFVYTEDIENLPIQNELTILYVDYEYTKFNLNEVFYNIFTDNNTHNVTIAFKYPVFNQKTKDQDECYRRVQQLEQIITDPEAKMEYYIKEYTNDDDATTAVTNESIENNIVTTNYSKELFIVYFNQLFNIEKYYNWNYEENRGKECDGTFFVEMNTNPMIFQRSKTGWKWTFGVDEKAEEISSITFSTSATTTTAIKKMIVPCFDYMTINEANNIFKADSYNTTNKYEGFTTNTTMAIIDKTRIANTISLSNAIGTQTISTVNSTTNVPELYIPRKLLNRKNLFNLNYTTNYDYINDTANINATATHSGVGLPYQQTYLSMIKNISLLDIENQYYTMQSTTKNDLVTSRGTMTYYLGTTNSTNTNVTTSNSLNFDTYPIASGTIYSNNANTILSNITDLLNNNNEMNFFTEHKYYRARPNVVNLLNNTYYWNNTYKSQLWYTEDNSEPDDNASDDASNKPKSAASTSYDFNKIYYFKYDNEITFDANDKIIKYLDNKKHQPITNKASDNNLIPCFNKDAWLLLKAQRTGWGTSQGELAYLYLTPEKYYIDNQIIYIYFIYIIKYDSSGIITDINLDQNCILYYYKNLQTNNFEYKFNLEGNVVTRIKRALVWDNNTVKITSICHLKDPYFESHIGTSKIYTAYFQALTYWFKNPYPGGTPVFFQDWCKSNKKLESKFNGKDTETRDYYYYSMKLPNKLMIESDDTFYQYKYNFNITNNNTNIFLDDDKNHYLVTYRLVEEFLPQVTYTNKNDTDYGFKNNTNDSYKLSQFMITLKEALEKKDQVGKEFNYYIVETTDDTLSINNHDNIFSSEKKLNLNNSTFKFYTNTSNTYEKSIYIKLLEDSEDKERLTLNNIKEKYYQYQNYDNFSVEPSSSKVDIEYNLSVSNLELEDEDFSKYIIYKYTPSEDENLIDDDMLEITEDVMEKISPYTYKYNYTKGEGYIGDESTDDTLKISLTYTVNDSENLYLEDFEKNLGFRHTFLNIPNKKYTNSFTQEHPFSNQNYYLDSDGCLRDANNNDMSPNGTFSISSGTLNPGVLVQIRGFNDLGEYTGDLNGGTLRNVTFDDGILHIKDTTDAWRKPVIDIINSTLKVKPKSEGGNIYASIVTEGGISAAKKIKGERLYGAIWNDYAEYRETDNIEAGRCVIETGTGKLKLSNERLQGGANIVSDTFGMGVGETEIAKTPIAVSGRVLAYPYEDRNIFKPGDAVCSGPNGTVSIMTREEIKEWPDRIVGYVSEIPYYSTWGTGKVQVNNRIWVKIH